MLKTRIFDAVGALSVTCWLAILAAFAYQQLTPETLPKASELAFTQIAITEGNTWLVLTRDRDEVGYIHESRTKVDDNWLFEYEMMMLVEVGALKQLIDTHTRATLSQDGHLEKFQGDISSFVGTFEVKGEVSGESIEIDLKIGEKTTQRKVSVSEPPRLSNTAINQLVAKPEELVAGKRYQQEFFDPMQQQMSNLSYIYIERKEVELYDTTREAYHFRQELMGDEFDVYVSPEGEILIQEFPMRTIASRLPEALGKTRISAIKRQLKENSSKAPAADVEALTKQAKEQITPNELGLKGSLKSLSNLLIPRSSSPAPDMAADMNTADMPADMAHDAAKDLSTQDTTPDTP